MGKTIKQISEEIGVSKQAVYKRLTGKLKTVCAPYVYKEYNHTLIDSDGEAIIKEDFRKYPCTPPLNFSQEYRQQSGVYRQQSGAITNCNPEQIGNVSDSYTNPYEAHTEQIQNTAISNMERIDSHTSISSVTHTEQVENAYGSNTKRFGTHTEQIDLHAPILSEAHTEQLQSGAEQIELDDNKSETHTEHIVSSDTEQSEACTDESVHELNELREKLHQMEIDLVKSNAEIEKRNAEINFLQQRIDDKEQIINDQRTSIAKIDDERKVLTASLFRNNDFIEKLMRLSLTKRIFGWNSIQKQLNDTKVNDIIDIVADDSDN